MITWTTATRDDGKAMHAAEIDYYRLQVFEGPHVYTWFAHVLRSRFDLEFTPFARDTAGSLKEAQLAALDAVCNDILTRKTRLIDEIFAYVRTL